jgi:hypothetical protein
MEELNRWRANVRDRYIMEHPSVVPECHDSRVYPSTFSNSREEISQPHDLLPPPVTYAFSVRPGVVGVPFEAMNGDNAWGRKYVSPATLPRKSKGNERRTLEVNLRVLNIRLPFEGIIRRVYRTHTLKLHVGPHMVLGLPCDGIAGLRGSTCPPECHCGGAVIVVSRQTRLAYALYTPQVDFVVLQKVTNSFFRGVVG